MPFCVQFEKVGCGLLWEAFCGEGGECVEGGNKKGSVLETAVNTEAMNAA